MVVAAAAVGVEAAEVEEDGVEAVEEADDRIEATAIATTSSSKAVVKAMLLAKATMTSPLHCRWESPRSGMK